MNTHLTERIKMKNLLPLLLLILLNSCNTILKQDQLPDEITITESPTLSPLTGELNPYGYPSPHNHAEIRRLIRSEQFETLDSLCKLYDMKSRNDYRYEYHVRSILKILAKESLAISFISQWGDKLPSSPYQKLAMARYYVDRGWAARGNGFVNEVANDSLDLFHSSMKTALGYIDKAQVLDDQVLYQWNMRFMVLRILGTDQQLLQCINESLKINPYQALIRTQFQENIQPRWGGNHQLMQAFNEQCQPLIQYNPKLAEITSIYYRDIAFYQNRNGNYSEALETYETTLRIAPNDAETHRSIGDIYYYKLEQYGKAIDSYKEAIRCDGHTVTDYVNIAHSSYKKAGEGSRSEGMPFLYQTKEFTEKALQMEPQNRTALQLQEWVGKNI